jgi:hypothetical protein
VFGCALRHTGVQQAEGKKSQAGGRAEERRFDRVTLHAFPSSPVLFI